MIIATKISSRIHSNPFVRNWCHLQIDLLQSVALFMNVAVSVIIRNIFSVNGAGYIEMELVVVSK